MFEAAPPMVQITGPLEIPVDEADGFDMGLGTPQFNSTRGEKRARSSSPLVTPEAPGACVTVTPEAPGPVTCVTVTPPPPGTPFVTLPGSPQLSLTPSILRSEATENLTSTVSPPVMAAPPIPKLRFRKNGVSEWAHSDVSRTLNYLTPPLILFNFSFVGYLRATKAQ